jgi:ABC-type uncharacterized transport system auxiliary subunit
MIRRAALHCGAALLRKALFNLSEMKGHPMKKVVVGLVLALTVAACSAPTTEPANTMVTPEPTSQKM